VCDVLGTIAEIFGELRALPEAGQLQRQALGEVCSITFAVAQTSSLDSMAELLRSLYCMADRYLVFARDVLLGCPAVPQLYAGCAAVLRLRDRDVVAQALAFLTHLVALPAKLPQDSHEAAQQQDG
jgi:hypothetical protein